MPKAKWTPPNDEVATEIDQAVELSRERREVDAKYRRALAALVKRNVPISHLAERLGVDRKAVYRLLGQRMP